MSMDGEVPTPPPSRPLRPAYRLAMVRQTASWAATSRRWWPWSRRTLVVSVSVGFAGAIGGSLAAAMSTAPAPTTGRFATGRILTPSVPAHPITSERQALARLLVTTEVGPVRRSGALETVWGAFMATQQVQISPGLQVSQDEPVWVAVVSPGGRDVTPWRL